MHIYKAVKGYPNYLVRDDGVIIGARGKPLRYDHNRTGYARVSLCRDGEIKRKFVHRIVAESFLPDPNIPDAIVNHLDGDKLNNHYTNLGWTTHKENLQHALDTGLRCMKNKVEMSDEQREEAEWMLRSGWFAYRVIAKACGVSYNAVALLNSRLRERATTIPKGSTSQANGDGSAQPS